MRRKPSICEIILKGKVIGTFPTRFKIKIEKFLEAYEGKKVTFRCQHCKESLNVIVGCFGWLDGIEFCPACFPDLNAQQTEGLKRLPGPDNPNQLPEPPEHYEYS